MISRPNIIILGLVEADEIVGHVRALERVVGVAGCRPLEELAGAVEKLLTPEPKKWGFVADYTATEEGVRVDDRRVRGAAVYGYGVTCPTCERGGVLSGHFGEWRVLHAVQACCTEGHEVQSVSCVLPAGCDIQATPDGGVRILRPAAGEVVARIEVCGSRPVHAPDESGCACPTTCDCERPPEMAQAGEAALVSNECPVHNRKPQPALDCPVHGELKG